MVKLLDHAVEGAPHLGDQQPAPVVLLDEIGKVHRPLPGLDEHRQLRQDVVERQPLGAAPPRRPVARPQIGEQRLPPLEGEPREVGVVDRPLGRLGELGLGHVVERALGHESEPLRGEVAGLDEQGERAVVDLRGGAVGARRAELGVLERERQRRVVGGAWITGGGELDDATRELPRLGDRLVRRGHRPRHAVDLVGDDARPLLCERQGDRQRIGARDDRRGERLGVDACLLVRAHGQLESGDDHWLVERRLLDETEEGRELGQRVWEAVFRQRVEQALAAQLRVADDRLGKATQRRAQRLERPARLGGRCVRDGPEQRSQHRLGEMDLPLRRARVESLHQREVDLLHRRDARPGLVVLLARDLLEQLRERELDEIAAPPRRVEPGLKRQARPGGQRRRGEQGALEDRHRPGARALGGRLAVAERRGRGEAEWIRAGEVSAHELLARSVLEVVVDQAKGEQLRRRRQRVLLDGERGAQGVASGAGVARQHGGERGGVGADLRIFVGEQAEHGAAAALHRFVTGEERLAALAKEPRLLEEEPAPQPAVGPADREIDEEAHDPRAARAARIDGESEEERDRGRGGRVERSLVMDARRQPVLGVLALRLVGGRQLLEAPGGVSGAAVGVLEGLPGHGVELGEGAGGSGAGGRGHGPASYPSPAPRGRGKNPACQAVKSLSFP